MLAEIRASNPDLNVEILGVNMLSDAVYNPLIVADRTLPWLQETAMANVWGRWNVTWRDVRIVDSQGVLRAVYNLTQHDLANEQNRATLKELFLSTARIVDSDGDHLPDDWEMQYFGDLHALGTDDSDSDGFDNFAEYAFGTNPRDPAARPFIAARLVPGAPSSLLNLTLQRRAGAFLDYSLAELAEVGLQTTVPVSAPQQLLNLFDGTGTMSAMYAVSASVPQKFIRVLAQPRAPDAPGAPPPVPPR